MLDFHGAKEEDSYLSISDFDMSAFDNNNNNWEDMLNLNLIIIFEMIFFSIDIPFLWGYDNFLTFNIIFWDNMIILI